MSTSLTTKTANWSTTVSCSKRSSATSAASAPSPSSPTTQPTSSSATASSITRTTAPLARRPWTPSTPPPGTTSTSRNTWLKASSRTRSAKSCSGAQTSPTSISTSARRWTARSSRFPPTSRSSASSKTLPPSPASAGSQKTAATWSVSAGSNCSSERLVPHDQGEPVGNRERAGGRGVQRHHHEGRLGRLLRAAIILNRERHGSELRDIAGGRQPNSALPGGKHRRRLRCSVSDEPRLVGLARRQGRHPLYPRERRGAVRRVHQRRFRAALFGGVAAGVALGNVLHEFALASVLSLQTRSV